MKRLTAIQSRLQENCRLKIEAAGRGKWSATISTELNHYPFWLSYSGDSPDEALDKIEGFLAGKVKDHARHPRDPKAYLRNP